MEPFMKILTMPERIVLLALYHKEKLSLNEIAEETQLTFIECFNIVQRLLVKELIDYKSSNYLIPKSSKLEVKNLLQQKEIKNLEIEQIVKSSLSNESSKLKLQEVQCSQHDLKVLRHYFSELSATLSKLKFERIRAKSSTSSFGVNSLKQII
jgi:DNA-binding MarR family transcriptional regulator